MNSGAGSGPEPERRRGTTGPRSGYHARSERRTARRAARRRKAGRLFGTAVTAVVVIAVAVTLLIILGGPKSQGGAGATPSTAPTSSSTAAGSDGKAAAGSGSNGSAVAGAEKQPALLVIEQDQSVPVLVLLPAGEQSRTLLVMPGRTLLRTPDGFKTLSELHDSRKDEVLTQSLSEMLAEDVGITASVQWSQLLTALAKVKPGEAPPTTLQGDETDVILVAETVTALVGAAGGSGGSALWEQIELGGDSSAFRKVVAELSASASGGTWLGAALPGRLVEGLDSTYFEPDAEKAKALLAGAAPLAITLEVQNGSGVVGVAEQVGQLLEPLGFKMLPFRNAPDFPDVKRTRVVSAPDAWAEARRVAEILGVVGVEQDSGLASGLVVVVVGADFTLPPTTAGSQG